MEPSLERRSNGLHDEMVDNLIAYRRHGNLPWFRIIPRECAVRTVPNVLRTISSRYFSPSPGGKVRGGGAFPYHRKKPLARAVRIPHDVLVREAEYVDAITREERIALMVVFSRLRINEMRLAINLDGESHARRIEVSDGVADRMLPPESHAELSITNPMPEYEIGCWHGRTEARTALISGVLCRRRIRRIVPPPLAPPPDGRERKSRHNDRGTRAELRVPVRRVIPVQLPLPVPRIPVAAGGTPRHAPRMPGSFRLTWSQPQPTPAAIPTGHVVVSPSPFRRMRRGEQRAPSRHSHGWRSGARVNHSAIRSNERALAP